MKKVMIQSVVATILCVATAAQAGSYSNLVIFGDSLSDGGNNLLAIGSFAPNLIALGATQVITDDSYFGKLPYASGRYTNGPVWAETLATRLAVSAAPSLAGGSNFAFGGAETSAPGTDGPPGVPFPYSMTTQLGMYMAGLAATGGQADAKALYVVAGGGNNLRVGLDAIVAGADATATVTNTAAAFATDTVGIVEALMGAGAQHILVWNTPDFGLTPSALSANASLPGASLLATSLSVAMNGALNTALAGAGVGCGVSGVMCFDMFSFLQNAVANASTLGLSNTNHACGAVINGCDPATSLFWDAIHPTAYGQQLLADAIGRQLGIAAVPEPSTYGLMALGLVGVAWRVRRQRQADVQA